MAIGFVLILVVLYAILGVTALLLFRKGQRVIGAVILCVMGLGILMLISLWMYAWQM